MVSAGETSGSLPVILERLSVLLERQAEMNGKILTTLAYPSVLAVVAMAVVTALMVFVVPQVVEQFDTVGQELPFLTRAVMGVSSFLVSYWWLLVLSLTLVTFGMWRALRNPRIKLAFDSHVLKLPLLGRLLRDLHAARMARTLATMVASRLPLLEGLTLTGGTIHNLRLKQASDEIIESIRGGGSLSAAMRRTGVFPPLLTYLAASGETAGQLDDMLERAADYLEREFDRFTTTALSLLEPLIIVVMGGVVATIVLSILLPIPATQHACRTMRSVMSDSPATKRVRPSEQGFTLIELMVVIVILGLLAAIVTFNVLPLGDRGKITKAKADIATIESALDLYKLQNDGYPTTTDGLQALVSPPADADASKYQRGGYIKKLPNDPWGRPYLYAAPGQHGEVDIWTLGADRKEGGEGPNADIGSWQ